MESVSHIWTLVLQDAPEAWAALVRRYSPLVYSVARRSGLAEADAEDCAQQTWLALYNGRHRVKDPLALPAWLIQVASRKANRMLRRQARHQETIQQADPARPERLPDEQLILLERLAQLEIALDELDERCHRVLRAIFLAPPNQTYRDIARELGMAPNSLGPTRTRCLNKLKKILKKLGCL